MDVAEGLRLEMSWFKDVPKESSEPQEKPWILSMMLVVS